MSNKPISRRNFLQAAGIAGAGIGLSGCSAERQASREFAYANAQASLQPIPLTHAGHQEDSPTPEPGAHEGESAAEMMDRMHEEGIQTFLDYIGQDERFWNNRLPYVEEDGFKVFELTCQEGDWEVEAGKTVRAMTYNGTVPGPEIRVTQGDMVRVLVHNEMEESTVVHWHGLLVPNAMDGVPFLTQPLIKPGETFVYEFEARNPGSHMYHSHHNALVQVTRGMLGPIIIEPADSSQDPQYDSDYTIVMNDVGIGLTLNGKSFPYTQPIVAKLGERVRIRYMNEGVMIHPMHLHGLEQLVFAKDGWNLPQPYFCDTVNVAPGERFDVIVEAHTPGVWAYHCHILSHAESAHGMFGMVTVMIVE